MHKGNRLGIQLGRLSPRPWPELKRFPFKTWNEEFGIASELGYETIEWIFVDEKINDNPLWSDAGCSEINDLIRSTGVAVDSVCADYFLANPFFRGSSSQRKEKTDLFARLLERSAQVGAKLVVLPVIENSEFHDDFEKECLCGVLAELESDLHRLDVKIGLETNLSVDDDQSLLDAIDLDCVGLIYDVGNHASIGHDCVSGVSTLSSRIINAHIKDRLYQGGSVFLGTGDVDFSGVIRALSEKEFTGDYIMEAYFEDDHIQTARDNYRFISSIIERGIR